MALGFMKRISPDYVLKNAIADMKTYGYEGLKPYLTSNGLKKIETVQSFSNGIGLLTGGMGIPLTSGQSTGSDSATAILFLLNNLSKADWTVRDVMKGSDNARGIVGFRYEDSVEGTVELTMIKQDKEWKIDDLKMPHFDKLSLNK